LPTRNANAKKNKRAVFSPTLEYDNPNKFCKFDQLCQDEFKKDKMEQIGIIIRAEREKRNLLLREASALLEIDQAILSKIERNERKATKEQILKFSENYNLDEEKLLINWLSDKIYKNLENEEHALKALKVAEQKIKYGNK
jgi:transcriptional regulator with XRE-family HTH domain